MTKQAYLNDIDVEIKFLEEELKCLKKNRKIIKSLKKKDKLVEYSIDLLKTIVIEEDSYGGQR